MKKAFVFLAAITVCSVFAFGQKTKVKENVAKIADGNNNALTVIIASADDDDVIKAWRDKMKSTGAKVSGKSSMFADDATIASVSSNTIDIYSIIKSKGEAVELTVAYNLGGAFLNSKDHSSGYKAAEKIMYDFAVEQAKAAVNKKISEQTSVISKLNKNKESLEKDNKNLKSDIENYKEKIESAEKDISKNESEIENKIKEISSETKKLKELEGTLSEID